MKWGLKMSSNFSARSFDGGTLFSIGLSAIVSVPVQPGQIGVRLNNVSGGTLFISGATGIASGYVLPSGDRYMDMAGDFYLSAAGATVVCSLIRVFNQKTSVI